MLLMIAEGQKEAADLCTLHQAAAQVGAGLDFADNASESRFGVF